MEGPGYAFRLGEAKPDRYPYYLQVVAFFARAAAEAPPRSGSVLPFSQGADDPGGLAA